MRKSRSWRTFLIYKDSSFSFSAHYFHPKENYPYLYCSELRFCVLDQSIDYAYIRRLSLLRLRGKILVNVYIRRLSLSGSVNGSCTLYIRVRSTCFSLLLHLSTFFFSFSVHLGFSFFSLSSTTDLGLLRCFVFSLRKGNFHSVFVYVHTSWTLFGLSFSNFSVFLLFLFLLLSLSSLSVFLESAFRQSKMDDKKILWISQPIYFNLRYSEGHLMLAFPGGSVNRERQMRKKRRPTS